MQNNLTLAICAYNCEKYIEETLTCIQNQTFQDFELLIVNDCSTDNTHDRIISFFQSNPRQYQLVDFEVNRGLAYGRYYVERNVYTKYILFIDADDCPYPTMVEKLYTKISNDDDLMAVGCFLEFIDSEGKKIRGGQFIGDRTKEAFYERAKNKKLIFLGSNAIFNREIALSVGGRSINGFFEGKPRYQDLCEDLDLWTRMSDLYINNKAIIVLPEILLKYRKHKAGISSGSLNMILRMRHVKKNLLRRRAGEPELTFIDFYNSLTEKELNILKKDAENSTKLRIGMFNLKEGKILRGFFEIIEVMIQNPKYFWQKIKSNSGIFR